MECHFLKLNKKKYDQVLGKFAKVGFFNTDFNYSCHPSLSFCVYVYAHVSVAFFVYLWSTRCQRQKEYFKI